METKVAFNPWVSGSSILMDKMSEVMSSDSVGSSESSDNERLWNIFRMAVFSGLPRPFRMSTASERLMLVAFFLLVRVMLKSE